MAVSEESVRLSDIVPHPRWSVTGPLPDETKSRDLVGIMLQISFQPGLPETSCSALRLCYKRKTGKIKLVCWRENNALLVRLKLGSVCPKEECIM